MEFNLLCNKGIATFIFVTETLLQKFTIASSKQRPHRPKEKPMLPRDHRGWMQLLAVDVDADASPGQRMHLEFGHTATTDIHGGGGRQRLRPHRRPHRRVANGGSQSSARRRHLNGELGRSTVDHCSRGDPDSDPAHTPVDTATPGPTTMHAVGLMVQKCVVFNHDLSQASFETHKEERFKLLLYFLLRSTSPQHEEFHAYVLREDKKMSWFERNKIDIYFLFYFLPCKEYNTMVMRTYTCDLLSLKESGWGPPGKLDVMHQLY